MTLKNYWYRQVSDLLITLSPECEKWLTNKGSMTESMRSLGDNVSVSVITQEPYLPNSDEINYLMDAENRSTYLREVIMHVNNFPWLYGRSVISLDNLSHDSHALLSLKNTALGDYLFKQPSMSRSDFEFCILKDEDKLLSRLNTLTNQSYNDLIARRSVFYLNGGELLLTEVFLPSMTESLI